MSFGGRKQFNPLDKRIPDNPRYKHIKPLVDSGASVTKYYERLEEMKTNYKYKKDEIFRRIKATTFIQLVLQIVSVGIDEGQLLQECPIHSSKSIPMTPPNKPHLSPPSTARSTLSDLVSGMGELDVSNSDSTPCSSPHQSPVSQLPQTTHCPYLLLDVRETDEYDKCHIITARNYPARMLSRSVNPFTKELFEYRNKPDHIIIIYDANESIANDVATKLVQRDFDNIFMLSGGLKVLYKAFPRGIITGVLPMSCRPSPVFVSAARKKPVINKVQPIVTTLEVRDFFTMDDIMILQQTLDEVLLASNSSSRCGSSRSSTVSTRLSTTSSLRSETTWKY